VGRELFSPGWIVKKSRCQRGEEEILKGGGPKESGRNQGKLFEKRTLKSRVKKKKKIGGASPHPQKVGGKEASIRQISKRIQR